jgi:hypothetical protein
MHPTPVLSCFRFCFCVDHLAGVPGLSSLFACGGACGGVIVLCIVYSLNNNKKGLAEARDYNVKLVRDQKQEVANLKESADKRRKAELDQVQTQRTDHTTLHTTLYCFVLVFLSSFLSFGMSSFSHR